VFATARKLASMDGLEAAGCTLLELNVTSPASVAAAVELVLQTAGRIDVLVNNAGLGGRGPVCEYAIQDAKRVFDVNYFGTMAMCQVGRARAVAQRARGSGARRAHGRQARAHGAAHACARRRRARHAHDAQPPPCARRRWCPA
jgi:NAD(P)-dependent dehydrogenase (short-subunit alcohol dehydrogenase family)